jgi:DNA invertase Pin-like site-specific DNA recombinase
MQKGIGIYARVSSTTQDTKSQEPELERYAASREEKIVWYRDKFTGTTMNRPGWKKLEADIRSGKIGTIVVWRLDRLGRTAVELTALIAELVQRKVNLVSLKEGIDLSTPAGRMIANVLASIAQFETEVRRERQTAGIAAAKASGKRWGGSIKGKRKKVTPTQEKMIRRMAEENEPITRIAEAVKLSRPTVYDVLNSPALG